MCRLFGMTTGGPPVDAAFWLLDAPDSMAAQSHRNADGSGIGFFGATGTPILDKQPEAAYADAEFSHEARHARAATFVAHVRFATTGARSVLNTHPFTMDGRIMAHNGGIGDLARLDEQLGDYRGLVQGDTDSERYFALITQQIDTCGGQVGTGITAAARWMAANLPLSSINTIVATPRELWALRYPGQHALHVIERSAGASAPERSVRATGPGGLHVRSGMSSIHAAGLQDVPSVVVASEELDGETGWRMLAPGELIHVRPDLSVESTLAVPDPPAHLVPLPADNPNIDT